MDTQSIKMELSRQATEMAAASGGLHLDLEYAKFYRLLCQTHGIDYDETALAAATANSELIECMAGIYYDQWVSTQ